jgi:hypothetical protein
VAHAREVIFVVSAGRSGSSALARVLSLCGGTLPLRLLPTNYGNPTGYWEPEEAVGIDDTFLLAHASSWYDTGFALQVDPPDAAARERFVAEIARFLATGFDGSGPLVVKEPRISGLLPYWRAAAMQLGLEAKFIHLVRSPADVASSLAQRDGLDLDHSLALWLKYNLLAERDARGAPRVFASYEELMDDWERVLARCIAELPLDLAIGEATRAAVAEYLSPDLHHHRAPPEPPSTAAPLAAYVTRAYEVLRSACDGALETVALDAIFADYAVRRAADGAQ